MYISEDFSKNELRRTYNACKQVLRKRCYLLLFTTCRICRPHAQRLEMPTKNGHLPPASKGIKSLATAVIQHPLKGVQGGDQEWGPLCSGKNWQKRPSDRDFQEKILWAQFLASPRIWKSTEIINGDICSSWRAASLCQQVCLTARPSPLKSQVTLPPPPLEQLPQSYLRCCLLGYSPHFVPK